MTVPVEDILIGLGLAEPVPKFIQNDDATPLVAWLREIVRRKRQGHGLLPLDSAPLRALGFWDQVAGDVVYLDTVCVKGAQADMGALTEVAAQFPIEHPPEKGISVKGLYPEQLLKLLKTPEGRSTLLAPGPVFNTPAVRSL